MAEREGREEMSEERPWPYKGMNEADLQHIENCLRYTVEDDDLAISVVQDLAAAGYMIVPISAEVVPAGLTAERLRDLADELEGDWPADEKDESIGQLREWADALGEG